MKNIISLISIFCALLFPYSTQSQTPTYKGLYVDKFDVIVGNTIKEDSLLHYLKDSSFNTIMCYGISSALSSSQTNIKNTSMASFIKKAHTQYGIKNIVATSETYETFLNLVYPYNKSRLDTLERFNYFYLEFEFWNTHSTNTKSSNNNGYYCTTYLSPKGYSCDTAGAFKYYKKMITSIDSLAAKVNTKSATYVGTINAGQSKFIGQKVDLVLIDNYTDKIDNIYVNIKTRMSYFGTGTKIVQIVPIFASYSPSENFLGDWLTKAPIGPHSEQSVYYSYFLPKYTAETGSWKSKLIVPGYQWYRYSSMPHNGDYMAALLCSYPTGISALSGTTTSITIQWMISSGAQSYNIKYRKLGAATWKSTTSTTNYKNIGSLSPAASYEYMIQSVCNSSGTFSPIHNITTLLSTTVLCAAPSGLFVSNIQTTSVNLNWIAVSGANSYIVNYRKIGKSTWTSKTTSFTNKTISGLLSNSAYEFKVQTVCSLGNSVFSNTLLFNTFSSILSRYGVNDLEYVSDKLLVYPNPNDGYEININITTVDETELEVSLCDMLGNEVQSLKQMSNKSSETNIIFRLKDITPGTYIIVVKYCDRRVSSKIIILPRAAI